MELDFVRHRCLSVLSRVLGWVSSLKFFLQVKSETVFPFNEHSSHYLHSRCNCVFPSFIPLPITLHMSGRETWEHVSIIPSCGPFHILLEATACWCFHRWSPGWQCLWKMALRPSQSYKSKQKHPIAELAAYYCNLMLHALFFCIQSRKNQTQPKITKKLGIYNRSQSPKAKQHLCRNSFLYSFWWDSNYFNGATESLAFDYS